EPEVSNWRHGCANFGFRALVSRPTPAGLESRPSVDNTCSMNEIPQAIDAHGTVTSTDESPPRPWGFWPTLAWAVVAFGLGALVIFGIAWVTSRDSENPDIIADPWFPLMLIGVNAVQVAGLAIAARAAGWPIARYLALVPPTRRDFLMGFFALIILIAAL